MSAVHNCPVHGCYGKLCKDWDMQCLSCAQIGVDLSIGVAFETGSTKPFTEDRISLYIHPEKKFAIVGVFDGHGGVQVSNELARTLHHCINYNDLRVEASSAIRSAFLMKNDNLRAKLCVSDNVGSVATCAVIQNKKLCIGHVGDTAGFLCLIASGFVDKTHLIRLTDEHRPTNPVELQRLRQEGAHITKDGRVRNDRLACSYSRSFGDFWSQGRISCEPQIASFELDPTYHKKLLLVSDGILDLVGVDKLEELMRPTALATRTARSICDYAIQQSKAKKCKHDDLSVAVISFGHVGETGNPTDIIRWKTTSADERYTRFAEADVVTCVDIEEKSTVDEDTGDSSALHECTLKRAHFQQQSEPIETTAQLPPKRALFESPKERGDIDTSVSLHSPTGEESRANLSCDEDTDDTVIPSSQLRR